MAVPNPQQDLEDFASGLYSPQQGSGLPFTTQTRQGGLPLGPGPSSAAVPQAPPVPAPTFQQAPLLTIGGQPSGVDQMIQQQLQALQNYSGAGYWDKFLNRGNVGTKQYEAMQQLPMLEKLASAKSQERQLQEKYLSNIASTLKEYSALQPEQQAAQRPLIEKLIAAHSQLAGLQLAPEDIKHTLSSPDLANQYASLLNDQLIPNQEALARLGGVKAGPDRLSELGKIQAEAQQRALSMVQQYLPQAIAKHGGTTEKPIESAAFVKALTNDPQLGPILKGSPTLERTLTGYLADKANAETLAGWGLKPGVVNLKAMEQQAQGPQLEGGVKDMLATLKGQGGNPLLPNQASTEQIAWAKQADMAFQVKKAAETGLSVEQFKRTLPAPGDELAKYIDASALVQNGEIRKPPPGTTVEQLYANKDLRFATPEQQTKLTALAPTRQQLDTFQTIADRLIIAKTPLDAFKQGIELTAGARLGTNQMAKAYADASEGFVGNLSRTLGGERGVLTDQDRLVMRKAAIATFFDTEGAKDIKKAIINDMYDAAHQAAVAEIAGQGKLAGQQTSRVKDLLRKLDDATNKGLVESAKSYMQTHPGEQVIRDEKGNMSVIRKGMAVPPGYQVVK